MSERLTLRLLADLFYADLTGRRLPLWKRLYIKWWLRLRPTAKGGRP